MNKKNGFISMTLVYTFLVLFMFLMLAIIRTYSEKDKYLQAISDQIDNDIGVAKGSRSTVMNKILEDNMPSSDYSLKYYKISNDEVGNGNGLYYMDKKDSNNTMLNSTDENTDGYTSRIYYFRGSVDNNNLIFANLCFKIIRTNEDGSIRVVYNGPVTGEGTNKTCNSSFNGSIGKSKFSSSSDGESVEYVKPLDSGLLPEYDFDNEQSPIIEKLNEWYRNSFITGDNYTDFISKDTMFCNNKQLSFDRSYYKSREISPSFINENAKNIYKDSNIRCNIVLNCEGNNDRFSLNDGTILYPVGLLTAQDIALAGGYLSFGGDEYNGGPDGITNNKDFYLYSNKDYWTMSPMGVSSGTMIYFNHENGRMQIDNSSNEHHIFPVISISADAVIGSGRGTPNDPYELR